jgi:hypothetical protein
MVSLARLPDLKSASCLAIYSQCWPARRGKTALADSLQAVTQETAAADDFLGACQVGILGTGPQAQAEQAAGDKMTCDFFQGDPLSVFFDLYHKIINRLHWPFKP